ncbi:AAA family ATPase [Natranaeroarchaeum aerophilus]|uniref:SMC family ATPase n=1 Tax=Natranaeroarchaeum aerophilus TaxID=2917711 RepID=A0AAE3FTF3_9EURY|nr:SMC family ATPase [Natranaeroarchaeum aerophilus]MCL9814988.1 SMC family ATPase [Natranaeroarchaeum aerophilus]
MRVTEVSLENVKSYEEKTTISLGEGVTAILGENGSGKSTIAEAIGFALFNTLPYNNQDEFVREGESSGTVWVSFEIGGEEFTVERSTNGTYNVNHETEDAELEFDTHDEVKDWIRRKFSLDKESDVDLSTLWEKCLGVEQTKFLSDFRGSQRTREEQFDPLLGLDIYEQAWSSQSTHNLKQPVDELKKRRQTASERINKLQGMVEGLPEQQKTLEGQQSEVERLSKRLNEIQSDLANAREEFGDLDELKERQDELKRVVDNVKSQIEGKVEQLETARSDLEEARSAAKAVDETAEEHNQYCKADELLDDLREQKRERDKLESRVNEATTAYRDAKRDFETVQDRAKEARAAEERMARLEDAYERYKQLNQKIEEAQEATQQIDENESLVQEVDEIELPAAEERVTNQKEKIAKLESKKPLAEAADELDEMRADLKAEIERQSEKLQDLDEQRERLLAVDIDSRDHEHSEEATCPTCDRSMDADLRDKVVNNIEDQIEACQAAIEDAEARLPAVNTGLALARNAQEAVASLDAERDRLNEFEEEVKEIENRRERLVNECEELKPVAEQLADLKQEQSDLEDDHRAYEEAEFEYQQKCDAIEKVDKAREEMFEAAHVVAHLERRLETEFDDLDEQIADQEKIKEAAEDAHNRYVRNEADAERLDERRDRVYSLYEEIENLERDRREAKQELNQVEADFDADRHAELNEQIDDLDSQETRLDTELSKAQDKLEEIQSEVERLETIDSQLERWKETHVQLERDIKFADTVRDGVRDAGPKMRELIANRIGERANQIYQALRGTGRESLTWDETYQITVQDGSQHKSFSNLSGGEKMAAALAVRLAIMEQISPLDIAVLDEPTSNLDDEKKNNLVRQLENLDAFEQLCVISHDDTFESMTEYTISLEKPDRETHVVSDAESEARPTGAD